MPPPSHQSEEWSTPPSVNRPPSPLPILLLPTKLLAGLILTLSLILLLVCVAPFLLLFRLLKYFHDKLVLPRSCDILWPRPPFTRAFLWLTQEVTAASLKSILDVHLKSPQIGCFVPTVLSPPEVLPWDHQKHPLHTQEDFLAYVTEKLDRIPYQVQVKMATGYENDSLGKAVLEIRTHPDSFTLCMTQILAALSQGNVTVEVEPRVFYECHLNPSQNLQKIRRGADAFIKGLDTFILGPLYLVFLLRLSPEKVWRALVAKEGQVRTIRRFSSHERDDSESSRLCIDSSVQLKTETDASFSITEICDVDELQKMERLLRATMAELLVSFLAGALRRYFRVSDPAVMHPPDCSAAFAVCSHKSSRCNSSAPCDHLVLPIQLPIGIEGMIPRLWSLQHQFAQLEERSVVETLKIFNGLTRFLLPRETANKAANVFFNQAILNFSFLRIHGDVMLDNATLRRFIPIPPLSLPSRASFVFVQHKQKILLVSSIDRGLFDRHNLIFEFMKEEQRLLIKHLSPRLRSLSQSCVLPERLPSEEAGGSHYPVAPEAPQNSPNAEREALLPGPSRPRRQSMADLSELLREVQDELDEMRKNPDIDRAKTIERLNKLELKIATFHNGMKGELWCNTTLKEEQDDAMERVKELLAPYQRRVSISGRKLSTRASTEYRNLRRASASTEVKFTKRRSSDDERRASEERTDGEEEGEREGRRDQSGEREDQIEDEEIEVEKKTEQKKQEKSEH